MLKQLLLSVLLAIIVWLLLVSIGYAQTTVDKEKFTITGHLWSVKADDKQVTVQNKTNRATIKFNRKTKINFNGSYSDKNKEPYSILDLKVGDYVRIFYVLDGNSKIATKVIAARY